LASLHSVSQAHLQDTILVGLGMTRQQLERWVNNTWIYLGLLTGAGIVSFDLGMLLGLVWLKLV
jgi:ABC-type xylose transport system substrate-binding protein